MSDRPRRLKRLNSGVAIQLRQPCSRPLPLPSVLAELQRFACGLLLRSFAKVSILHCPFCAQLTFDAAVQVLRRVEYRQQHSLREVVFALQANAV